VDPSQSPHSGASRLAIISKWFLAFTVAGLAEGAVVGMLFGCLIGLLLGAVLGVLIGGAVGLTLGTVLGLVNGLVLAFHPNPSPAVPVKVTGLCWMAGVLCCTVGALLARNPLSDGLFLVVFFGLLSPLAIGTADFLGKRLPPGKPSREDGPRWCRACRPVTSTAKATG
jgi:hypothetical protein